MRAVVVDRIGGPEVLRIVDMPMPKPSEGEVLVRIAYASVNPADWKVREGLLSRYISYRFPFVPGFDLAGVIEAVGAGVTRLAPGDHVFGTSRQSEGLDGSYAEFALAHEAMLSPIPGRLSFAEAAVLPTAGIAAYGSVVDVGGLTPRQTMLINGGSGGVGSIAVQIGLAFESRVIATCSGANSDYVASLGAEPLDYRRGDVIEQIREKAPHGVDIVLDAVGMDSMLPHAETVTRTGGLYVEIETLISAASEERVAKAAMHGIRIVSNMIAIGRASEHLASLARLVSEGKVRPPHFSIVPLDQVAQAQRDSQAGHARGKIAIEVDPRVGI